MLPDFNAHIKHCKLTIRHIAGKFRNRGDTTGEKQWEVELLESAKALLNIKEVIDKPCPECKCKVMFIQHDNMLNCSKCDYMLHLIELDKK